MWSKRKEDEYPPRPGGNPPVTRIQSDPVPSSRDANSSAPPSQRIPDVDIPHGVPALVGKSVSIKGQILSREDITMDGEFEGTIEAFEHRLTVGANGRVKASLKAREVIVLGQVFGNIEATDRVEIRRDAKLVGDVRTSRISIEDGAFFKGGIDIVRPEMLRPERRTAPADVPPSAPAPPIVDLAPAEAPAKAPSVPLNAAGAEAN